MWSRMNRLSRTAFIGFRMTRAPRSLRERSTDRRRSVLLSLSDLGARVIRKPINAVLLNRFIRDHIRVRTLVRTLRSESRAFEPSPRKNPVSAPSYTPDQLTRLSSLSSETECECPNHLASLTMQLRAFEDYSEKCESANDEDAELHRFLYNQTAKARVLWLFDCTEIDEVPHLRHSPIRISPNSPRRPAAASLGWLGGSDTRIRFRMTNSTDE